MSANRFADLIEWLSANPTEEELIKKAVNLNLSLGDIERGCDKAEEGIK